MSLDLAHIGFTTTILESVATSVGAGMLLSGFAFAAVGFALGRSPRAIEAGALRDACIGGVFAVGLLLIDSLTRYIV